MANELQQRAFNSSIGNAWMDIIIMAATNALFFIDLGLSTLTGLPTITILLQPYQQYTVGVLAIFCVAILLGLFVVDRYFANNSYKFDAKTQLAFGALSCFVMGFGGFFFGLTQSVIVITLCFFLPPMLGATAVAYQIYAANGYGDRSVMTLCTHALRLLMFVLESSWNRWFTFPSNDFTWITPTPATLSPEKYPAHVCFSPPHAHTHTDTHCSSRPNNAHRRWCPSSRASFIAVCRPATTRWWCS